jgi:hypothetical protein
MSREPAPMSMKVFLPRLIMAAAGLAAVAWVVVVFPVLWSQRALAEVAGAVIAGEAFKPDVLAAVVAQSDGFVGPPRAALVGKVAVIRLRQAEDASRMVDADRLDRSLESLGRAIDKALGGAPQDPFLWLARFWLDTARQGLSVENLRLLRMSYHLGPHEGWIAIKRNRVALAAFPALPADLADRAVSEFVEMVRWGLIRETADIAAATAPSLRAVLFSRLKDIGAEQRQAFARAIYARELDDVPVPGFPPPTPQMPMPVFPPGF